MIENSIYRAKMANFIMDQKLKPHKYFFSKTKTIYKKYKIKKFSKEYV